MDWVSGASMMVRREVFTRIGGLDETFFLYFEETEFCHRAKRAGFEVCNPAAQGCCGALHAHGGDLARALQLAKTNIAAFQATQGPIVVNSAGCGAMLKDYAHQFVSDPVWEPRAAKFAAAARDFAELCTPLAVTPPQPLRVAYHPACSLQNSLKLNGAGEALLEAAGFIVTPFLESHLCCGSAGTYSILQPELSNQLRARKLGHIAAAEPDVLVSGNIGCLQHLAAGAGKLQPILHIAELLDWAEGGVKPVNLELPRI